MPIKKMYIKHVNSRLINNDIRDDLWRTTNELMNTLNCTRSLKLLNLSAPFLLHVILQSSSIRSLIACTWSPGIWPRTLHKTPPMNCRRAEFDCSPLYHGLWRFSIDAFVHINSKPRICKTNPTLIEWSKCVSGTSMSWTDDLRVRRSWPNCRLACSDVNATICTLFVGIRYKMRCPRPLKAVRRPPPHWEPDRVTLLDNAELLTVSYSFQCSLY